MTVIATERLDVCYLTVEDAPFILRLVNTPEWIQYIGDRNVHTNDDAIQYIVNGPVKSYETHGFGLFLVKLKNDRTPVGICGLIKRDSLEDVDIGFAYLPEHMGKGYAFEAASATLRYGIGQLKLPRIVAITVTANQRSIKLLEKLGMAFDKMVPSPGEDDLMLFAIGQ